MDESPTTSFGNTVSATGWLNETVALITGGAGGIGRAVVERYIEEGAKVGVLDRNRQEIEKLKDEFGNRVVAIEGDVTSGEDYQRALDAVIDAYGRLDVFVGNAGIFDFFKRFDKVDCDTLGNGFDEIFSVNVKGYLLGARITAEALRVSRGSMIFTVSNSGLYAGGGGVLYVASKHAVVGLVRQLAYELAPDVRVNGVAPGGTNTDIAGPSTFSQAERRLADRPDFADLVRANVPLGVLSEPEDHTGIYVLLASKANSGAMTGAIIPSDGGMEVRGAGRRENSK